MIFFFKILLLQTEKFLPFMAAVPGQAGKKRFILIKNKCDIASSNRVLFYWYESSNHVEDIESNTNIITLKKKIKQQYQCMV